VVQREAHQRTICRVHVPVHLVAVQVCQADLWFLGRVRHRPTT
jgi:hypothetical protein